MTIFDTQDYRAFIQARFAEKGQGGRGQIAALSKVLRVSASLVGQTLKGTKGLTEEQAVATAVFLELNEGESDYFLSLVQLERAGTPALKKAIQRRLERERIQSLRQSANTVHANELRPQDQAVFYSGWDFSAVRLMSSLEQFGEVERLARRLGLPKQRVTDILEFLLQSGLSTQKDGVIQLGPTKTLVDRASPYRQRHHINWRVKALENVSRGGTGSDLTYTAPMTIRKSDGERLRKQIHTLLDQAEKYMDEPNPDTFCCLLIDWFGL